MLFCTIKKQKLHPFQTTVSLSLSRFSNTAFLFYQIYGRIECEKYFNVKD